MFENNLRNITNSNPIFNSTLNLISNYLPPDLKTLYFSNQQVPIISGDSYFIHYSVFPMIKPKNQDPTLEKARQIFQEYANSQRYQNLRSLTMLDHEVSLVYGISLAKLILEKIKEEMKRNLQKNGDQNPNQTLQQLAVAVQNGNQNAQQQLQALTQQALSNVLSDKKTMEEVLNNAEQTTKNAKEIKSLLGQKASKVGSSFEFLLDLTEQMKEIPDVRQIITLGNKISTTFFSTHIVKTKSKHGDELAGYGITHSPIEALPRELALPDDLFYYKFANGFLMREKQFVSEGAYYVLVDKSGSMGTSDKIIWSRSVALALYKLARAKKRDYYLQFFDTSVYPHDEPYTIPEDILRSITKVKSEGGTSIDTALKTAISLLNKKYAQKTNSIIIITDGEDDVYTTKQQLGKIQLISVMIQGNNPTLRQLSSQFMKVAPDEKGALKLLEVANQ
jgi:uncharacterized protein with von Willebrand factor type A (vWA) domain